MGKIKRFAKSVGAAVLIAGASGATKGCLNKLHLDPPDNAKSFEAVKGLEDMLAYVGHNIAYLAGDHGQNLVYAGTAVAAGLMYHLYRKYLDKHDY